MSAMPTVSPMRRAIRRVIGAAVPTAAGCTLAAAAVAQTGPYHSGQGDPVLRTPHVVPAPAPSPYLYTARPEGRRWNPAPIHDGVPPVYSPRPLQRPLPLRSAAQAYPPVTPPASVAAPAYPRSNATPALPPRAAGAGVAPGRLYGTSGSVTGTRGDKVYGTRGSSTGTRGDKVYRTQGNPQQRPRQPYSGPINVEVQPVVPLPGHGGKPRPPGHGHPGQGPGYWPGPGPVPGPGPGPGQGPGYGPRR